MSDSTLQQVEARVKKLEEDLTSASQGLNGGVNSLKNALGELRERVQDLERRLGEIQDDGQP